jgi:hypothetical protein
MLLVVALTGCSTPPAPAQAAPAPTPVAEVKAAEVKAAPEAEARPTPAPPLTQEELDLIAADPATLTPERRRARAFALRKKIMQNPDSPAARNLEEIRRSVERGEVVPQLPNQGLVLSAPSHAPKTAPAPAGPAEGAPR